MLLAAMDWGVAFFLLMLLFMGACLLVVLLAERGTRGVRTLQDCVDYAFLEDAKESMGALVGSFRGRAVSVSLTSDTHVSGWIRLALKLPGRPYSQPLPSPGAALSEQLGAQAAGAREALDHLARFAQQGALEVRHGWLVLRRHHTDYALSPQSLEATLAALSGLVPLLARTELDLILSPRNGQPAGVGAAESSRQPAASLAWRESEGGAVLCPYCRDDLLSAGLELERCEACHTVQHAECLAEAGRCAVFGCAGERRERVLSRQG